MALTDYTFLRAFFAGIISVPELTEVTKKFLTVHTKTTEVILDLVHADFCAMTTKEHMVEGSSTKGSIRTRRIPKLEEKEPIQNKVNAITKVQYRRFPKNTNALIPPELYKQFKDWYNASAKSEHEKTKEDREFLQTFKFVIPPPKPQKRVHHHDSRGSYNEHRNARRVEYYPDDHDYDRERYRHQLQQQGISPDDFPPQHEVHYSRGGQGEGLRGGYGNGDEQGRTARRTMFQH